VSVGHALRNNRLYSNSLTIRAVMRAEAGCAGLTRVAISSGTITLGTTRTGAVMPRNQSEPGFTLPRPAGMVDQVRSSWEMSKVLPVRPDSIRNRQLDETAVQRQAAVVDVRRSFQDGHRDGGCRIQGRLPVLVPAPRALCGARPAEVIGPVFPGIGGEAPKDHW
jgi:hypothetical protein